MTFTQYSGRLITYESAVRSGHKLTLKRYQHEPYDMNINIFRATHTPMDPEAHTWWEQTFGCRYEEDPWK